MRALSQVHDVEEGRSALRRIAVAGRSRDRVGACVIGSILLLVAAPRAGCYAD
ncbi:MAG: hypothetical protein ACXVR9_14650 [Gaiellaceae bacterium]